MKRFEFSLEKAKRFREAELRMEEARYSMLRASEAQLRNRISSLRNSHEEQRRAVSREFEFDGTQLERLHQFGEFVSVETARIQLECDSLRKEIEAQASRVSVSRRRVELLEKLKHKERSRWTSESAKELQLAAEESFNARWLRERTPTDG